MRPPEPLNVLVDENMPRSLQPLLAAIGMSVQDVRDIGLRGRPDSEVLAAAEASDAIVVTRDRGFCAHRTWPPSFTAGVIFVNLSDRTTADDVNSRVCALFANRRSSSLLGALTVIEHGRALSRPVRRR